MIKLVLISDTHNRHREILLPEGDILVCAGDFSSFGAKQEVVDFSEWLGSLPFKHKIVVPGNHETSFDAACHRGARSRKIILDNTTVNVSSSDALGWLTNCHILIDRALELEINSRKIKFYGSPYTPEFCGWAFNSTSSELQEKWKQIPEDAEVIITHGPPLGILDECPPDYPFYDSPGRRVGCKHLLERVLQIKPKLHVFGHIHHSYGQQNVNGIHFVNAAICNEQYWPSNPPIVFEL